MYTIKEIKAILTDFYEFKTSDTPSALSDIMESVQNLYTQYNKSSKDSEKKNCFNALNEYMKQYDSMKWILENLERSASKKHPDYTINHYRDDNSTEIESISGDIIVEDMLEKVHIRS